MEIRHLFFDLDHTLWDFEKNSALAFEILFEKHQINLDFEKFLEFYVPANFKYWEMYRKDEIDHLTMRYRRLRDTFDFLDYAIDEWLDEYDQEEILDYFKNCDTSSLQIAQEELSENDYSWEQLKIMRIKFLSVVGN